MNRTVGLLLLGLLLFIPSDLWGQNEADLAFAKTVIEMDRGPKKDFRAHSRGTKGLWSGIASGAFLFYKANISSQDSRNCMYDLSCSAYAMESIRAHGFWQGWLLGLDRYTRCNGMHGSFYPDAADNREHDPVKNEPQP